MRARAVVRQELAVRDTHKDVSVPLAVCHWARRLSAASVFYVACCRHLMSPICSCTSAHVDCEQQKRTPQTLPEELLGPRHLHFAGLVLLLGPLEVATLRLGRLVREGRVAALVSPEESLQATHTRHTSSMWSAGIHTHHAHRPHQCSFNTLTMQQQQHAPAGSRRRAIFVHRHKRLNYVETSILDRYSVFNLSPLDRYSIFNLSSPSRDNDTVPKTGASSTRATCGL